MRHSAVLLLPLLSTLACGESPPPPPEAPTPPPALATAAPAAPAQPVTVKRSVIMDSRPSGSSVATAAADGTVTIAFDVQWNGRGPHADATIHLAKDGTIASLEAHGHHMVGAPVDETFAIEGGRAHWKSREESGEKSVTSPAFFVPIADLPDTVGYLAEALLKAGGTLGLLPDGQAHIEKLGDATVTANGSSKHITAYDVLGIDLAPTHIWMQDDGTWFAFIDPGFSLVPEGWESVIDPLVEKQRGFDRDRDQRTAQRLAHRPPAAGLAYTHARVLDVVHGKWLADQTVVVVGDTIKTVGPSATTKAPAGAETVDLGGKALLPGLWDMHSHLGPPDGALDIASGVTTARDVGNDPDRLDDYKKRFDDGSAVGPHVLRAGFVEGRGPKAASSKITAETEAEAKAAVEFYAKRGYEMMKIYNSVKPELVPTITKEAHAHGMTVTGHIPVHMLANEAVKAGYDGIEHVNMLFLNFLADHDTDTRTPLRFTLVGDKGADLDLKSKPVQDFFALLRQRNTVIDPTFDVFEHLLLAQQGKVVPGTESLVARLPVQVQRNFLTGELPIEGKAEAYARSWERVLSMVRALTDAKIAVVAGTDDLAGLMLDHELELFVRGGLSTAEALRDATIVPAHAMKLDAKTGSIAPGKAADLFVVDGDPLASIADVRKVVTTVRGGVVYPSKEVFETVGVRYWQ
jgi:imidazolonepropionase-like amidohydrolase